MKWFTAKKSVLGLFRNVSLNKKENGPVEELQPIVAEEGVVVCALFDREGRLICRAQNAPDNENEIQSHLEHLKELCNIVNLYLGPEEHCENVHLHYTEGEIVLWDFGPFLFVVTGKDIRDTAGLRLRANVLKHSLTRHKSLSKHFRDKSPPSETTAPAQENTQPLYAILEKGGTPDEQS